MCEFLKESLMANNFWTALSAIMTAVASGVALWVAIRQKPFYKIKNIHWVRSDFSKNKNGKENLYFELYNMREIPMKISRVYSAPNTYKSTWKNTDILCKVSPPYESPFIRGLRGNNSNKVNSYEIPEYSFRSVELVCPPSIVDMRGENNKILHSAKQKKIIIITNFGKIEIPFPKKYN